MNPLGDVTQPDATHVEPGVIRLVVGVWESNCYIVAGPNGELVVIDPAADAERILDTVGRRRLGAIFLTHAHRDHTGALAEVRTATGAPLMMHHAEADLVNPTAERLLSDDDAVAVGEMAFRVLHTPGHSPGGLCFLIGSHLFSGDTLFPNGPGYSRTPSAFDESLEAITERLLPLPDHLLVHPGHGEPTLLGREKLAIRRFLAAPRPPIVFGDVTWLPPEEYQQI